LEHYQAGYDKAVIQAKPPCWPNPDVDTGKERDEAEGKQRDGGANMNPRQEDHAVTDGKQQCFRRGRWRGLHCGFMG
jgi:hypothetical protein